MTRFIIPLCLILATGCSTTSSSDSGRATTDVSEQTATKSRCSIGFRELFVLAKGREWTQDEVTAFQALDQPGKNRMVKQLAAEAGCIRTEDQVGTDGIVYTAFWKE